MKKKKILIFSFFKYIFIDLLIKCTDAIYIQRVLKKKTTNYEFSLRIEKADYTTMRKFRTIREIKQITLVN